MLLKLLTESYNDPKQSPIEKSVEETLSKSRINFLVNF